MPSSGAYLACSHNPLCTAGWRLLPHYVVSPTAAEASADAFTMSLPSHRQGGLKSSNLRQIAVAVMPDACTAATVHMSSCTGVPALLLQPYIWSRYKQACSASMWWRAARIPDVACRHIPRLADYLWVAEDGMKMQGYNGSQLWDTAFAVQAIAATGFASESSDCLRRAHQYIDATQVRDSCLST